MADTEEIIDLTEEVEECVAVVPGKPEPMPRPRFWQHVVNTARPQQKAFAAVVKDQIVQARDGVVFGRKDLLHVEICFFMRRPNTDFRGAIRGEGRLKSNLSHFLVIKPDIDNLSKFVLDALRGVLYVDDDQIVKLTAYKLRDSTGTCEGRTEVRVSKFNPSADFVNPIFSN